MPNIKINVIHNHSFFYFVGAFSEKYSDWVKTEIDINEIVVDLTLLACPEEVVEGFQELGAHSKLVPSHPIFNLIQNHKRLKDYINKMDNSIFKKELQSYAY